MAEKEALTAITALSVKGFKSFVDEQRIEIRPLTLLAGANSSGKSSAMQPLLLLKQTLDAPYDPGPLLLDGPNVRFTAAAQALAKVEGKSAHSFNISIEIENWNVASFIFREEGYSFEIAQVEIGAGSRREIFRPEMPQSELKSLAKSISVPDHWDGTLEWDRFLLSVKFKRGSVGGLSYTPFIRGFASIIRSVIHVPGLRGTPERAYRTTAVGDRFSGTFENYISSLLHLWQIKNDRRANAVGENLKQLGLTSRVETKVLNAAQIELLVARLPRGSSREDLVNIADVGFGVSQVLPVLVALQVAEPAQLVYIEQPELHLHPRAQQAMAEILADAARRGVRVIVETHSSILLLAVQSLVAEGKLDPALVKLHWFQRDERGATQIHSTDLDENGAYGDWPEDFGEVQAEADNRYLDAIEARVSSPRPAAKRAKVKKK